MFCLGACDVTLPNWGGIDKNQIFTKQQKSLIVYFILESEMPT